MKQTSFSGISSITPKTQINQWSHNNGLCCILGAHWHNIIFLISWGNYYLCISSNFSFKTVSTVLGGGKIKIPSHRTSIHKSQLLQRERCLSGQMSLFPEWTCKFMQVLHSLIYSYMLCKCLIVCCWITMAPQKDYIIHVHTHTSTKRNK